MYRKRYILGFIEDYYPGGLMVDADYVTSSKQRGIEYVLKKLMVHHFLKKQEGLEDVKLYGHFALADMKEGLTIEMHYNEKENPEYYAFLDSLLDKYYEKIATEILSKIEGKPSYSVSSEDFDIDVKLSPYELSKFLESPHIIKSDFKWVKEL